jgi:cell wall-associated NlpC family hydrolase
VTDGRTKLPGVLVTLLVTSGVAVLGGSVLTAVPAAADPSIDDVRARVDRLYHQAEQASERYNQAREDLADARVRHRRLAAAVQRQEARVARVRADVAGDVVAEYQGDGLATASQALMADDPDSFLGRIVSVAQLQAELGATVVALAAEAHELDERRGAAGREVERIERTETLLAEEKENVDEKAAAAKALLGRMEERARERMVQASRSGGRVPVGSVPASGRAGAAVQYALAQVGDAYVYGAAGPSAFDCSGLTMAAWAQAGVGLPHSSSAQMGSGAPVSASALQAGDLVFYYSPVSHVGMYIGNGMIVHAGNPSTGVRVDPLHSMPFSGAVRPG